MVRQAASWRGLAIRQRISTAPNASRPARSTTPISTMLSVSSEAQIHFTLRFGSAIQKARMPDRCTSTSPSFS